MILMTEDGDEDDDDDNDDKDVSDDVVGDREKRSQCVPRSRGQPVPHQLHHCLVVFHVNAAHIMYFQYEEGLISNFKLAINASHVIFLH